MKPRIAIPLPTSADLAYNRANWPAFARAVEEAGGEPVEWRLDLSDRAAAELARSCAGYVLPGSPADWAPEAYGQVRGEHTASADPAREQTDRLLLEHAMLHGRPLLGVCFGMQSMNVWRGGTLVQDLPPLPVPHSNSGAVKVAHPVEVVRASLLGSMLAVDELSEGSRLPVNSSHHQAADVPGQGLRVVARCPIDGVVEAVEDAAGVWLLGVQWHPERTLELSGTSRNLFAGLVEAACR